jgi:hypothetical protein
MPGKSRENRGLMSRPKKPMTPPRSPIFMMPSHKVNTPVNPNDISKAKAAWSNELFIIVDHIVKSPVNIVLPNAIKNAMTKNAIHI